MISSDQVGLGQVKLARFPLMTGTRGLPYRTIPGALYNFFLGRLADGLVSIILLASSQVRLRGERKGRDLRARQRERVQESRALKVSMLCSDLKTSKYFQSKKSSLIKFPQLQHERNGGRSWQGGLKLRRLQEDLGLSSPGGRLSLHERNLGR